MQRMPPAYSSAPSLGCSSSRNSRVASVRHPPPPLQNRQVRGSVSKKSAAAASGAVMGSEHFFGSSSALGRPPQPHSSSQSGSSSQTHHPWSPDRSRRGVHRIIPLSIPRSRNPGCHISRHRFSRSLINRSISSICRAVSLTAGPPKLPRSAMQFSSFKAS